LSYVTVVGDKDVRVGDGVGDGVGTTCYRVYCSGLFDWWLLISLYCILLVGG